MRGDQREHPHSRRRMLRAKVSLGGTVDGAPPNPLIIMNQIFKYIYKNMIVIVANDDFVISNLVGMLFV